MRIKSVSIALLIALIAAQGAFAQPPDCASGAFLKRYLKSGLAAFSPDGAMELRLDADLHSADCGAPDCHGTTIRISMKPIRAGSCQYSSAIVETKDYNTCGEPVKVDLKKKIEVFLVDKAAFNVLDQKLATIKLMNKSKTRAIVLAPDNFFYFEDVRPKGKLHMQLPGDDDNRQKCCWGASMSQGHFKEEAP